MSLFPLPIHLLLPFNRYPPSTFLTLVYKLLASDPTNLSVNPHPDNISNLLILGNHFYFYSSDPNYSIVNMARQPYTVMKVPNDASTLAHSAVNTPYNNILLVTPCGDLIYLLIAPFYLSFSITNSGNSAFSTYLSR